MLRAQTGFRVIGLRCVSEGLQGFYTGFLYRVMARDLRKDEMSSELALPLTYLLWSQFAFSREITNLTPKGTLKGTFKRTLQGTRPCYNLLGSTEPQKGKKLKFPSLNRKARDPKVPKDPQVPPKAPINLEASNTV